MARRGLPTARGRAGRGVGETDGAARGSGASPGGASLKTTWQLLDELSRRVRPKFTSRNYFDRENNVPPGLFHRAAPGVPSTNGATRGACGVPGRKAHAGARGEIRAACTGSAGMPAFREFDCSRGGRV